ncbi:hypothetical protein Vadar_008293 [Vaccinium darrowii]|uniref:Uncharacterized protein n=1 Tax=Vaccinium darrowii TaxID=229202 RepID=A0ACB7XP74_9ERIC|nr:hypothetical protein Vadar_008293 [Vaccinium darrowii]
MSIKEQVRLRYPSEFVTGISGYYSPGRIISLAFITNKGTYGPFGGCAGKNDTAFEYKLGEDNTFEGFHGTVGKLHSTADAHLNYWDLYETDDDAEQC